MIALIDQYFSLVITAMIYLFVAFVFVMKVKHKVVGTKLELPGKIFLGAPFVVFDWWVNILLIPLFLDAPGSFTELVTGRMKRYKKLKVYSHSSRIIKWRFMFAVWICQKLNQHDKDHC
ncbi:MAG: hypothetical protein HOM14_07035 [Gammaproteobacteria bacterium]|jgi:hypothetical protein|nr:hypothetical protein [Gammaproteobacteria bacterium]